MPFEILRPNAAGDETNLSRVGDVANYLCVDEEVADDYTTYVQCNTIDTWLRDLYELSDPVNKFKPINKITAFIKGILYPDDPILYPIDQDHCKIAIKTGGVVDESAPIAMTVDWGYYSHEWALNPDTGKEWIYSDLLNLQVGLNLRPFTAGEGVYTIVTQVYVEVDFRLPLIDETGFIEIRDSNGNLIAVLENVHAISYEHSLNKLGTMSFELPADDPKGQYLLPEHELWLYHLGELVDVYKLKRMASSRD